MAKSVRCDYGMSPDDAVLVYVQRSRRTWLISSGRSPLRSEEGNIKVRESIEGEEVNRQKGKMARGQGEEGEVKFKCFRGRRSKQKDERLDACGSGDGHLGIQAVWATALPS